MNAHERGTRERIANVVYEIQKQEIKVMDMERALADKKKSQEEQGERWSTDHQFFMEDLEFQIMVDKCVLAKLIHQHQFLTAELAKCK